MTSPIEVALATAGIPASAMLGVLDELGLSCSGYGHLTVDLDWPYASLTVLAPASDDARRALRDRLHARDVPASVIVGALDRPSRAWLVEIGCARAAIDVPIKLHARGDGDALTDIARLGRGNDPLLEATVTSLLGGRVDAIELDESFVVLERDDRRGDAHAILAIARRVDAPVDSTAFLAAHERLARDSFTVAVMAGRDGVSGVRARYATASWAGLFEGLALFRGEQASATGRIAAIAGALDATRPVGLSLSLARTGLGSRVIIDVATAA